MREKELAETFQAQTKLRRVGALGQKALHSAVKVYANPLEIVRLPVPQLTGGQGLWQVMATNRESIVEGGRLSLADVAQIMWATSGYTYGGQRTYVTPVPYVATEAYVFINQVESVFPGVYHYNPKEHVLEQLKSAQVQSRLSDILQLQQDPDACAMLIAFTGIPERISEGSKGRAYRYLYLEAGAAAQCAIYAALALSLVANEHAEFVDDEVSVLLQIDGVSEFPLSVVTIGT